MNSAFGKADNLPFNMSQHRWPIEYRVTPQTQVRQKRYESLTSALTEAFKSCQESSLKRAEEMMLSLDTDTFSVVAAHEYTEIIEMRFPAKTTMQFLVGTSHVASIRRLIDLGAIRVIDKPYIGYGWTNDGLQMIKEINRVHPKILSLFREEQDKRI